LEEFCSISSGRLEILRQEDAEVDVGGGVGQAEQGAGFNGPAMIEFDGGGGTDGMVLVAKGREIGRGSVIVEDLNLQVVGVVDLVAQAGAGLQEQAVAAIGAELDLSEDKAAQGPAFVQRQIIGPVEADKIRADIIIDQKVEADGAVKAVVLVFEELVLGFELDEVEIEAAGIGVGALNDGAQAEIVGDGPLIVEAGGGPGGAAIGARGIGGAEFDGLRAGGDFGAEHAADILGVR